jgi:hypothetical protein
MLISISLLIAINVLFINKYLSRISEFVWIGTFIILLLYIAVWILKAKIKLSDTRCNRFNKFDILTFFLLSILVFKKVTPESLNVDRWSVISSFWEAAFLCKS